MNRSSDAISQYIILFHYNYHSTAKSFTKLNNSLTPRWKLYHSPWVPVGTLEIYRGSTHGCLENSDPQTLKTQTLGVSRKLRPFGCLENSDPKDTRNLDSARQRMLQTVLFTVRRYLNPQRKKKQVAVEETYTDHENNIQRVSESTGAKFSCVTVSQPANVCPASDSGSLWFDALSWFEFLTRALEIIATNRWQWDSCLLY